MQNYIIMSLPIIIIAEVVLPHAITTFNDMRAWSCTCTWMRDNVHYHGNIKIIISDNDDINEYYYLADYECYKTIALTKLEIMRNIKYLHLLNCYGNALASVRFVDELCIENYYKCDLSHVTVNKLTLDSTNIKMSAIPQVSHLNIYYHHRDINLSHLTKLESLNVIFSDFDPKFDLSLMTSLTSLCIRDHDGSIPCMLNLCTLHAPNCQVHRLATMTNLTDLDACVTNDDLHNLRSLKSITIRPPDIIPMTTLRSLKAIGVSITMYHSDDDTMAYDWIGSDGV